MLNDTNNSFVEVQKLKCKDKGNVFSKRSRPRGRCFWPHLVLHDDLRGQGVVSVPLLVEAEAQVLQLVLGLQVTPRLSCVRVVGARRGKLLTEGRGTSTWRITTQIIIIIIIIIIMMMIIIVLC